MRPCDYLLYLVTDRGLSRGRATSDIVREAVAGGVTCVQLREKDLPTRAFISQARHLVALLRPMGIPLIINDRLDVALAAGADGVHLGQKDMEIADARRLSRPGFIIGISAESFADAVRAQTQGADYIGISPVFATRTKRDAAPPLGLDGVRRIRAAVDLPLVGIGGINADNAAATIAAGADGIAVVSAIVAADCPRSAAAALKNSIVQAPRNRFLAA
jgi:thiamine-phosphate pyrophosphorylase